MCSKWFRSDENNTTALEIDNITATTGYSQVINKPRHFVIETFSCKYLIFSSNMTFIRNYVIEQSVSEKCDHSVVCETLDFHVIIEKSWFKKCNKSIQKLISDFNCIKHLTRRKSAKTVMYRRINCCTN